MSDEFIVARQFFHEFGKHLDFYDPKTFNEKIQLQKLYFRDPKMTNLADKYEARKYVESKGYKNILNELYGVYDRPEDIDFETLPNRFVIKCNHSWNTNIICKDRLSLNKQEIIEKLKHWVKNNHYYKYREWSYKNIKPKITVEKYLPSPLKDYKLFCFNGRPKYIQVDSGRYLENTLDIYDVKWNRLNCKKGNNIQSVTPEVKPIFLKKMLEIATDLSSDFNFCRVDFFANSEGFYFAEITFYPGAGLSPFDPEEYDVLFGSQFDVSNIRIPIKSRINISIINFIKKI